MSDVRDLADQLRYEDEQEDIGRLNEANRKTCHTCQAWITDEHIESPEHKRAIGIPVDWRFDKQEGRFRPDLFSHLISRDDARVLITRERSHSAWDLFLRWYGSWVQYQRADVDAFLARDITPYLGEASR